jgi:hypothetical protein
MRSVCPTPPARYVLCVAAGAMVVALGACGGGDRPQGTAALGSTRLLRAVPTLTPSPPRVRIDVGGHPGPIATADGALWVTVNRGRGESRIVRIDAAANRVVASTAVTGNPFHIAAGMGAVWVTGNFDGGDDVLYRIDTGTNRVAATIRFPGRYAGPVAAGEGAVWLTLTDPARAASSLARIDPATNTVERIVPLDAAHGRYVDDVAVGHGAVWLLALRFGESGELPGDLLRFDPEANEIAAIVHAEALNMGVGPGGVWVTGCVDCGQHRDTFFAQEIDTEANAPVGPRLAVDHVGFGPLLVARESVWFSGYGAREETVAFRLEPDTHAIEPFLELGDFLHTAVVLDERTQTLWAAAAPRWVVRVDLAPATRR